MPVDFQQMLAPALDGINDQPEMRLDEEHHPPMKDRGHKTQVPIVAGDQQIKILPRPPMLHSYVRYFLPLEGGCRNGLVLSVYKDCVVGCCSPKKLSPPR